MNFDFIFCICIIENKIELIDNRNNKNENIGIGPSNHYQTATIASISIKNDDNNDTNCDKLDALCPIISIVSYNGQFRIKIKHLMIVFFILLCFDLLASITFFANNRIFTMIAKCVDCRIIGTPNQ